MYFSGVSSPISTAATSSYARPCPRYWMHLLRVGATQRKSRKPSPRTIVLQISTGLSGACLARKPYNSIARLTPPPPPKTTYLCLPRDSPFVLWTGSASSNPRSSSLSSFLCIFAHPLLQNPPLSPPDSLGQTHRHEQGPSAAPLDPFSDKTLCVLLLWSTNTL